MCEHDHHVGTCPSCQRRQLERVKNHNVQATLAAKRWLLDHPEHHPVVHVQQDRPLVGRHAFVDTQI